MPTSNRVDRNLLVFAIWSLFGLGGLCFVIEGFARDAYLISAIGTATIVAGFIAHIVVNFVFGTAFGAGESALGIGVFGVLALAFVLGWASGELSQTDYWSGLTLFAVIGLGLPVYLSTRYGLRGAFSRFHVGRSSGGDQDV